ncbi:MAG TPA: Hsp20/alpha crystallin family protein [Cyclobacteriaceae bacterium]|nr:Hsp20/alpha crystallin family protein [Cyclobacteriaceae bacterium]
MKTRKFVSPELLASIDVLNTLNGGVSESQLNLKQLKDHREIRLKVPGVSEESLKVEIHNNTLSVFYEFHLRSNGVVIEVPKVVYNRPIPYFVDANRISASYHDGFLVVTLPYNSLAEGYHRQISIL